MPALAQLCLRVQHMWKFHILSTRKRTGCYTDDQVWDDLAPPNGPQTTKRRMLRRLGQLPGMDSWCVGGELRQRQFCLWCPPGAQQPASHPHACRPRVPGTLCRLQGVCAARCCRELHAVWHDAGRAVARARRAVLVSAELSLFGAWLACCRARMRMRAGRGWRVALSRHPHHHDAAFDGHLPPLPPTHTYTHMPRAGAATT
jgi:hypothetical protein